MKKQDFAKFQHIEIIQPQRVKLIVPSFTLAPSIWRGASTILAVFAFNNGYYFSLKLPIAHFGSNFLPAISYVENGVVIRFKLWNDTNAILFYPVYNGEAIGPNARLEIWSLNSIAIPSLTTPKKLSSSVLTFPLNLCSGCCQNPGEEYTLTNIPPGYISPFTYCDPFCLPLQIF